MKRLFSSSTVVAPITNKSVPSSLHSRDDSNENILNIIKLYHSQETIEQKRASDTSKCSRLQTFRSSNVYLFMTAAFGITSSVYMNSLLSFTVPYIIEYQIEANDQDSTMFSNQTIGHIMSLVYFFGLSTGSLLFGWLGNQTLQRKLPILLGLFTSISTIVAFMIPYQYWMLFPSKFLQGFSNGAIWLMCSASIADEWSLSKWGSMVGLIGGLYPLGMTYGLTIGGVLYQYVGFRSSLVSSLIFSSLAFFMQLVVIEKPKVASLDSESLQLEREVSLKIKNVRNQALDMENGGLWSRSSSMSTINLRDYPAAAEEEANDKTVENNQRKVQNLVIFRLFAFTDFVALIIQMVIISAIVGSLKLALSAKLMHQMHIVDLTYQNIITATFLLPCSVSCFIYGWLCNRFGFKTIGLTSLIISVPSFVWIGASNQNVQSLVAALTISGMTIAGVSISMIFSSIQILYRVSEQLRFNTPKRQQQITVVFGLMSCTSGIGFFLGSFLVKLHSIIGFFWFCFILAGLLMLCIPFMVYFLKKSVTNNGLTGLSVTNTSKKSLINNGRPESFEETDNLDYPEKTLSMTSLGPSHKATSSPKPVIVTP
ncbi:MAG: major facilitator superfamily domain-containing protein [Benjaminiella poitrasii]|nr:MAG: major facilitator superfamily domain-containing protein [Benjaminiella poitrasii]